MTQYQSGSGPRPPGQAMPCQEARAISLLATSLLLRNDHQAIAAQAIMQKLLFAIK